MARYHQFRGRCQRRGDAKCESGYVKHLLWKSTSPPGNHEQWGVERQASCLVIFCAEMSQTWTQPLPPPPAPTHEWKIDEVRFHSDRWKQHARSRYGTLVAYCGSTLGQSRRHSSNARTCSAVPGPADRICSSSRGSWRKSHQPHPPGYTVTQSCKRNDLLKSVMRLDKGPLRGSSRDSRRTASRA